MTLAGCKTHLLSHCPFLTEECKKIRWKNMRWNKFNLTRKANATHRSKVKRWIYSLHSTSREMSPAISRKAGPQYTLCAHAREAKVIGFLFLAFSQFSLQSTRSWECRECSFGQCLPDVLAVQPQPLAHPQGLQRKPWHHGIAAQQWPKHCVLSTPSQPQKQSTELLWWNKLHWSQAGNPRSPHMDSETAWSKGLKEIDAIAVEEYCADMHICMLCSDAYKKLICQEVARKSYLPTLFCCLVTLKFFALSPWNCLDWRESVILRAISLLLLFCTGITAVTASVKVKKMKIIISQ